MKKTLYALFILIATGCAVIKTTPQLDYEFSAKGEMLASNTELVSGSFSVNRHLRNKFSKSKSKQQLHITDIQYKKPSSGFQCFHPYFLILSLGLIPTVCSQDYIVDTKWIDHKGKSSSKTTKLSSTRVVGWAALFTSMFKNWNLTIYQGDELVIFNEVNSRAH